jgi:hypothetical protein
MSLMAAQYRTAPHPTHSMNLLRLIVRACTLAGAGLLAGCVAAAGVKQAGGELPVPGQHTMLIDPSADVAGETPAAALQRVATGADAHWHVDASLLPGRDTPTWALTSDRAGFVYILRASAVGDELNLVYPPASAAAQALRAGQPLELPRSAFDPVPAGTDRLLMLVGDTPLRSGDLLVKLGLAHYAAAACLRRLGSDDCPSTAAGPGSAATAWRFGAVLLPLGSAGEAAARVP